MGLRFMCWRGAKTQAGGTAGRAYRTPVKSNDHPAVARSMVGSILCLHPQVNVSFYPTFNFCGLLFIFYSYKELYVLSWRQSGKNKHIQDKTYKVSECVQLPGIDTYSDQWRPFLWMAEPSKRPAIYLGIWNGVNQICSESTSQSPSKWSSCHLGNSVA